MTKENFTWIEFILDRSGSMAGGDKIVEATGAINQMLEEHKNLSGDCSVGITIFNGHVEEIYSGPISTAPLITREVYYPRGMTALLDAIGISIDKLGKKLNEMEEEARPSRVIVAIITDGLENVSRNYSVRQIKSMIDLQSKTYSWEFVFMAADINSVREARDLGIQDNSIYNYRGSMVGATASLSNSLRSYRISGTKPNFNGDKQ